MGIEANKILAEIGEDLFAIRLASSQFFIACVLSGRERERLGC